MSMIVILAMMMVVMIMTVMIVIARYKRHSGQQKIAGEKDQSTGGNPKPRIDIL